MRVGAGYQEGLAGRQHVEVRHQLEGEERHRCGRGPRGGGVDRARVVAAFGAVVVEEARRDRVGVHREGLGQDTVGGGDVAVLVEGHLVGEPRVGAVLGVDPALPAEVVHNLLALLRRIVVLVAAGHAARHVVHRGRGDRLDTAVCSRRGERHTAQAADGLHADPLAVDDLLQAEEVDGGAVVLGVDVGRSHVAHRAAALPGEGGVEGEGDVAAAGELVGVETRGLFLDRAERAADRQSGQLAPGVLRHVEVCGDLDAVAVLEQHRGPLDVLVQREGVAALGRGLALSCGACGAAGFRTEGGQSREGGGGGGAGGGDQSERFATFHRVDLIFDRWRERRDGRWCRDRGEIPANRFCARRDRSGLWGVQARPPPRGVCVVAWKAWHTDTSRTPAPCPSPDFVEQLVVQPDSGGRCGQALLGWCSRT